MRPVEDIRFLTSAAMRGSISQAMTLLQPQLQQLKCSCWAKQQSMIQQTSRAALHKLQGQVTCQLHMSWRLFRKFCNDALACTRTNLEGRVAGLKVCGSQNLINDARIAEQVLSWVEGKHSRVALLEKYETQLLKIALDTSMALLKGGRGCKHQHGVFSFGLGCCHIAKLM